MVTETIEKRRRGVFGWIVAVLFWTFNAVMAVRVFVGTAILSRVARDAAPGAEAAVAKFTAGIGISVLFAIWFFGAATLGIMMYLTRGRKVTVTREI
ncbi:hypothetical protein L2U69_15735 [Zavarzinia compransoris]|uniref:hypothetical protein n=1 Tax=Zavarzinia marina TaxID=2911065 RepID=UPI001F272EA4|nr:hypothetical protein [Zavarzinia marina]MCF4167103.1 hypothetical protein [Zavarzinia marina]